MALKATQDGAGEPAGWAATLWMVWQPNGGDLKDVAVPATCRTGEWVSRQSWEQVQRPRGRNKPERLRGGKRPVEIRSPQVWMAKEGREEPLCADTATLVYLVPVKWGQSVYCLFCRIKINHLSLTFFLIPCICHWGARHWLFGVVYVVHVSGGVSFMGRGVRFP